MPRNRPAFRLFLVNSRILLSESVDAEIVIAVPVTDDDMGDGQVGQAADLLDQAFGHEGAAAAVEHDDTFPRTHLSGGILAFEAPISCVPKDPI